MMVADYYAMLGIDSIADRNTIELALAKAQPVWSAGTRNPKKKHTYQSYLDRIPAIRQALLGDPTSRAAYDAELAAARRAEHDAKLDELQRLVKLRSAKGGLTVSDRSLLRAEADRLGLPQNELDSLLAPISPMPEMPTEDNSADPPPDIMDPAARRQIRTALDHIRRRDLYDVLGLPHDTPMSEILKHSDAERQKWMKKTQVTAEKTAWLEAVSYAQSHLSQVDNRARYDRTLRYEAEERLTVAIEFAIKGTTSLWPGTREVLREEAVSSGIEASRADRLIDRACRALGVSRDSGPTPIRVVGLVRYIRCRSCSGLTEYALASRSSESAVCRHCRASLRWSCPICRRDRWVDEPRCACGFPLEHIEPLIRYFEAAQHAHRIRDFASALANLRRVQEFAPRHIGARKGIEKIKERIAEIDGVKATYEIERSRRHLVAARVAVMSWARLVDPGTPELRQAFAEITEGLKQAMALAAKAGTLTESEPQTARKLYRQALSIASDLSEAHEGLRQSPPPAPTDLCATVSGDRVRLRWTAGPTDGLGHCRTMIRRKRGSVPRTPDDGVEVAEVDETEFDDLTATPGDTIGYTVFSIRSGVTSLSGVSVGPVPILADVTELKAEAASGEILLTWRTPPNSFNVRVVRKLAGAPIGPEDGTVVASLPGQAHDRGLTDETVYHYCVYVLYRAADGRTISSPGAYVSCMPSVPILTVIEPKISQDVNGIHVSWHYPKRGQVQVFRTFSPFPHPPGELIDRRRLDGLNGTWVPRIAPDHVTDRSPAPRSQVFYTPMIAWAGRLTVGQSVMYSHVPDPTDLRAVRVGRPGRILLRWKWPLKTLGCIVVYRVGESPTGPNDPAAISIRVDASEYARLDSFPVMLSESDGVTTHFAVYSCHMLDGREVLSPGTGTTSHTLVPASANEVELSYEISSPKLFHGTRWVIFHTDPPKSPIPPTAVVAHARTVPFSADDGEIIARFSASMDGARFRLSVNRRFHAGRLRIFADPNCEPGTLVPIRIRHPDAESTRV